MIPRITFFVLFSAVLVGFSPPTVVAQDEPARINLQPQWQTGQTSRYEVWTRRVQRRTVSAGGQQRQQEVTAVTTGEVTWRVDRVRDDGGAACEMNFDWLRITLTSDDGEPRVNDSRDASGDNARIHNLLTALTSGPVNVSVAPDGRIEGVSGIDAIQQRVQQEAMAPSELDFIESANGLAAIAAAPAAAANGAEWQSEHTWSHEMGRLHEDMQWQLQGVERIADIPVATVTGRGELELEVDRSKMPADGPQIDVELAEGSTRTQVMFDMQRHEAVGRNSVQQTVINVNIQVRQRTIRQRIEQRIQSQALRISED